MSKTYFCQLLRILGLRKEKYVRCGVLLRVSDWEFSKFVLVHDCKGEQSPLIHKTLGHCFL